MNPNLLLDPLLHATISEHVRALFHSASLSSSPVPMRAADAWRVLPTFLKRLGCHRRLAKNIARSEPYLARAEHSVGVLARIRRVATSGLTRHGATLTRSAR
jgi:hypothetical protein